MFPSTRTVRRSFAFGGFPRTPRRRLRPRDERDPFGRKVGKILLLGRIRELALYRAEFLQGKGYEVIAPRSRDEAVAAIRRTAYDVAVLSYTLPNELVLEYAQLLREYCPLCPLIVISDKDLRDRSVAPDAVVIADEGPDALLRAIRQVVTGNS